MVKATEKEYMYFNFIQYGYHTICSVVRKLLEFPALVVFFITFNMAEMAIKEIVQ